MDTLLEQAGAGIRRIIRNCGIILGAWDDAPTASQGRRGLLFRTEAGDGQHDEFGVILKNGSNGFSRCLPFFSASSNTELDVDSDVIRIRGSRTIEAEDDTGLPGQIAWDADYLYVAVGEDEWKRVAIETWGD